MTPDRTLSFRGDSCKGGKRSKERVTVLVAASALGEKLPLLVIGKSKRPHCFRGVLNLPVEYDANQRAWMTSEKFEKWLMKVNNSMRVEGRKIAMILENFSGHPNLTLSRVKLFFLPPNTTSMTQPMDAGIINRAPSFDTAVSVLDTALKFLRTLPCSEKQCQSVRELQNFLVDHQLGRLQQSSITRFF